MPSVCFRMAASLCAKQRTFERGTVLAENNTDSRAWPESCSGRDSTSRWSNGGTKGHLYGQSQQARGTALRGRGSAELSCELQTYPQHGFPPVNNGRPPLLADKHPLGKRHYHRQNWPPILALSLPLCGPRSHSSPPAAKVIKLPPSLRLPCSTNCTRQRLALASTSSLPRSRSSS